MTDADPRDPQLDHERDAALRRALDALPAERTPPAHVWSGIQQAMAQPSAASFGGAQRQRPWPVRTVLRSAAVVVVVLGLAGAARLYLGGRDALARGGAALAARSANGDTTPLARAVAAEREAWARAAADPVRSARWPQSARHAVDSALAATDRTINEVSATRVRDSTDAESRALLATLHARQLDIMRQALLILDEL